MKYTLEKIGKETAGAYLKALPEGKPLETDHTHFANTFQVII
jgi:hypothetical protein